MFRTAPSSQNSPHRDHRSCSAAPYCRRQEFYFPRGASSARPAYSRPLVLSRGPLSAHSQIPFTGSPAMSWLFLQICGSSVGILGGIFWSRPPSEVWNQKAELKERGTTRKFTTCSNKFLLQSTSPGHFFIPPLLKGDVLRLKVHIVPSQSGHFLRKENIQDNSGKVNKRLWPTAIAS